MSVPGLLVSQIGEELVEVVRSIPLGTGGKSQFADCSAAIRDSSGGWLLNSAIIRPPAIPLAAISFGNWPASRFPSARRASIIGRRSPNSLAAPASARYSRLREN
jgi:hypothetical protein